MWRACEFKDARCPECGYMRKGKEDPSVRRQRLEEAAAGDSTEDRTEYLGRRVVEALCKGWKLGAAKVKFMLRYTPHSAPVKTWPHRGQLADSGYTAAEELLHELSMINQVRHTDLRIDIHGIRSHVDPKALVQLCRRAIGEGQVEAELDGQRVRVTVAEPAKAALEETGT